MTEKPHDIFDDPHWSVTALPSIRGAAGRGIQYPSVWPEGDYLLRGGEGYRIRADENGVTVVETKEGMVALNTLLEQQGLTPLEERTPVLSVGSNRAPRQLFDKLSTIADATEDDLTVPAFSLEVPGMDVVFAGRPSFQGSFPAVLYAGEETAGTTVDLAVSFLNTAQLEKIDNTEGGSYQRMVLPGCDMRINGEVVPVEYYQGTSAVFWDEQGPRALSAVRAEGRTIPAYSQADFMDVVLSHLDRHGGMKSFEGIYFDADSAAHRQILRSYRHVPPYAQELSATFYGGHVNAESKPKVAGTAATSRLLGELGLSKMAGVPEGFTARVRRDLSV